MTPEAFHELVPGEELRAEIARAGTPCYLFFGRVIERRIAALRGCLGPRFALHFAVKSNPHPELLRFLVRHGLGFDVASGGELARVLDAGSPASAVELTGPGKGDEELATAVACGIGAINVESLSELDRLAAIATPGAPARVGFRVSPRRAGVGGVRMGADTPLGLREEDLPAAWERVRAAEGRLRLVGLHVHRGSQVLDPEAIADHFAITLELAASLQRLAGPLEKVNFGGGWGVDYWEDQRPLDLAALRRRLAPILAGAAAGALSPTCRFVLEPGRLLVAEAGIYAVSVRHVKQGHERLFAVADGGIHHCHLLSAGLGQVLRRDFRHAVWTGRADASSASEVTLVGPLCLPHDLLLQRASWPGGPPQRGDQVAFYNCGAYGLTASPVGFLGHPPPREVLL